MTGPRLVLLARLQGGKYLDVEVLPDEGKESGGKVHPAFSVQRHVHADQLLVGQPLTSILFSDTSLICML